jgi:SAM-dependent methyltransferase
VNLKSDTTMYQDGEYQRNNPGWHAEDSPWKAAQISSLLKAHDISPNRLCEVGCGVGEILVNLSSQLPPSSQLTGFEISPQAFAVCNTKSTSRLHFSRENPFDQVTSGAPQFDVAMAIDVFEHVEDYLGFLRQMRGLGRYKIFHVPLDLSVQTVLRGDPIRRVREIVGHLHYFTKETALASLKHAGYEVVDFRYTAGSLELPHRGWKAAVGRLPRKLLSAVHHDLSVRILGGYSLLVLAT